MIDNLIFRSSVVGGLCGKTGLGATGEKLAIKTYLQKRYGRYKEITNKYLERVLLVKMLVLKLIIAYLIRIM